MKAKDVKVGMRYAETDEEVEIDTLVCDVELLLSGKTLLPRGAIVKLLDGSVVQWMDADQDVSGVISPGLEPGTILSLSTSHSLWEVVRIEPWSRLEGFCVVTRHATPGDRAKWPGFVDRNDWETQWAISTICEVEEHVNGYRWAVLPEGSNVEPEAVRPDGTGLVCIERPEEA